MAQPAQSKTREMVLNLRAQGMKTKKIAEVLGLSENTVKTHLRRAQAKTSNLRGSEAHPDGDLQEILKELEPECSLTLKVETLARKGLSPSRIAHITGATQGTVRQILYRQRRRKKENRGRKKTRTYTLAWEELQRYKREGQNRQLSKDEIAFLYKIYVEKGLDNMNATALALLGTQGLGGWKGRRAVFKARKEIIHTIALTGRISAVQWNRRKVTAEIKLYGGQDNTGGAPALEDPFRPRTGSGTIKARKGTVWWALCEDLLEGARQAGGVYQPKSWRMFAEEMAGRVKEALSGLAIEKLGQRGEVPVYRISIERVPAIAVRTAPQGGTAVELVWEVPRERKNGKHQEKMEPKGRVVPMAGNKVALVDGESKTIIDRPAGITFSARGRRWVAADLATGTTKLLRRGDLIQMEGGIVRVVKWESEEHRLKVVEFSGWDLAWAVAAYVIRRPCWLIVDRPGEPAKEWDFKDLESRLAA
ncbi:helix-turn-helix transcriptional regulator [Moorellaceae bacterium AZ2]